MIEPHQPTTPTLLTVEDVARELQCSTRTVKRLRLDGTLTGFKLRGLRRYYADEVRMLALNRGQPRAK